MILYAGEKRVLKNKRPVLSLPPDPSPTKIEEYLWQTSPYPLQEGDIMNATCRFYKPMAQQDQELCK